MSETYSAGIATAYGAAKRAGYTGTYSAFCAAMAAITDPSATASGLPAGSDPTAAYNGGVFSFGIPKGDKGDTGETGPQGPQGETGETGNGIASIEKTATVGKTDTYTITYTDGTTTTFDVTNGEVTEAQMEAELAKKANMEGTYSAFIAGLSKTFDTSSGTTIEDPYNLKASGGNGVEKLKKIVGASVGWNQLVNTGATSVTVTSGHKYYAKVNGVETVAQSSGTAISINDSSADMVVDLTLALGSTIADYIYALETATAGAGVAWLKTHFPKMFGSYQPYDAGSIQSVTGLSAHKMTGFNQYSGEGAEDNKAFKWADGTTTNEANSKASGYIRVIPGAAYYTNYSAQVLWYDENKGYLGNPGNSGLKSFTIPSNVFYVRLGWRTSYNNSINMTAVSDINVNLHYDGERDGEYEAYKEWNYPLDDSLTLSGIPKLDASGNLSADGDEYEADGTVNRRYAVIQNTAGEGIQENGCVRSANGLWCCGFSELSSGSYSNPNKEIRCDTIPFILTAYGTATVDCVCPSGNHGRAAILCLTDATSGLNADSTKAEVATALVAYLTQKKPTILYQLETPTTESADPFTESQIVDNWGTEEFVSTSIVPVGNETFYLADLKGKLEDLPAIPEAPTTNGTYVLKATVSGGVASYSWVSE